MFQSSLAMRGQTEVKYFLFFQEPVFTRLTSARHEGAVPGPAAGGAGSGSGPGSGAGENISRSENISTFPAGSGPGPVLQSSNSPSSRTGGAGEAGVSGLQSQRHVLRPAPQSRTGPAWSPLRPPARSRGLQRSHGLLTRPPVPGVPSLQTRVPPLPPHLLPPPHPPPSPQAAHPRPLSPRHARPPVSRGRTRSRLPPASHPGLQQQPGERRVPVPGRGAPAGAGLPPDPPQAGLGPVPGAAGELPPAGQVPVPRHPGRGREDGPGDRAGEAEDAQREEGERFSRNLVPN